MMQCCLGALDTDDEDGTRGRTFDLPSRPLVIAFDWLGIEHRCAAACVSKHYYNRDRPTPPGGFKSIYNGDGSLRRVYPHWSQMPWCVDIHERLIPPDRYHSYRGRLSAGALAERRREREEEDY